MPTLQICITRTSYGYGNTIILFWFLTFSNAQMVKDTMTTLVTEELQYIMYYPKGYQQNIDELFPLLLFLHGGGESGNNLDILEKTAPLNSIAQNEDSPFVVLAPLNPLKLGWWNTRAIMQLLDTVEVKHKIDKQRIYLTGSSRGAGAAWELAVNYPTKFAAMIVVSGMAPAPYAVWIDKEMPIWVFHGADDEAISVNEAKEMVHKLKERNCKVKLTIYPNIGHNAWDKAYGSKKWQNWLLQYKRD